MLFAAVPFEAQRNVFTENFNAPGVTQSSAWTTAGPIGNSRWNVTRSGNDFGGKIEGGMLTLSNDVSSAGNSNGWVLATTSTSNFAPGYNPILNQNAGIVSWNFNMRQSRGNPSGLTNGSYGVAYVLAGTADSSFNTGSGYAIMLGNGTNQDPIRFVHYTNGISTYYTKFSSSIKGFKDFGKEYISVRVEYNPATSKWSFYLRNDGSSFKDPKSGTLMYQGDVINNEHIINR